MKRGDLREFRDHPIARSLRHLINRLGLWAIPHFIDESFRAMWRSRALTLFAIAIVGLSLATVGSFLLVAHNLGVVVERLSSLDVPVYLHDGIGLADIEALQTTIAAEPGVAHTTVVTAAEALAEFRRSNPQLAAIADALGNNPLPAAIEVSFAADSRTSATLHSFANRVGALSGVDHVGRDLELAERFAAASRVVKLVAASLGSVLLLSALFTVSNVVKLTAYTRRQEVEIMRVVGATTNYIRGTFVVEGMLEGLLGAGLGLLILLILHRSASAYLAGSGLDMLAALTTRFLGTSSILAMLAAGASLGAAGSLSSIRRASRS